MSVYPMWCVVCRNCGFVGTRWEKPGTAASYIESCPSCGRSKVTHQEVQNQEQHEAIKKGEIDYDDVRDRGTFDDF